MITDKAKSRYNQQPTTNQQKHNPLVRVTAGLYKRILITEPLKEMSIELVNNVDGQYVVISYISSFLRICHFFITEQSLSNVQMGGG